MLFAETYRKAKEPSLLCTSLKIFKQQRSRRKSFARAEESGTAASSFVTCLVVWTVTTLVTSLLLRSGRNRSLMIAGQTCRLALARMFWKTLRVDFTPFLVCVVTLTFG